MNHTKLSTVALAMALTAPLSAVASSVERDILVSLYQATNGDEWQDNEGWLSEEDYCDWFGVFCQGNDPSKVTHLELSNNGLSGQFPESLIDLTGLQTVDLANNDLAGPLPDSLGQMNLRRLDLAGNQLEGNIAAAVAAMSLEQTIQLDLAENSFSGSLPEDLMALSPVPSNGRIYDVQVRVFHMDVQPGLNLCGNDFDNPDAELESFIEQHHFGAAMAYCQEPRKTVDATLSGSRFNPQRSGEGVVHHLLDNGNMLLLWFTHALGEQAWFLRVTQPTERSVHFDGLHKPDGRFGEGGSANMQDHFRLTIDRELDGTQHMAYSAAVNYGGFLGSFWFTLMSQNYGQVDLTRLAGTTCDNQQPHQWISGAWYDPARSGEGFMVEVNEDGRVVVYWFTYAPDDSESQAWMIGTGEFAEGRVVIDEMIQPVGTRFGSDFDKSEIELIDWGSLTLTFFDDGSGEISYESNLPEYGSGSYPIERLARPMLAECEEGANR